MNSNRLVAESNWTQRRRASHNICLSIEPGTLKELALSGPLWAWLQGDLSVICYVSTCSVKMDWNLGYCYLQMSWPQILFSWEAAFTRRRCSAAKEHITSGKRLILHFLVGFNSLQNTTASTPHKADVASEAPLWLLVATAMTTCCLQWMVFVSMFYNCSTCLAAVLCKTSEKGISERNWAGKKEICTCETRWYGLCGIFILFGKSPLTAVCISLHGNVPWCLLL